MYVCHNPRVLRSFAGRASRCPYVSWSTCWEFCFLYYMSRGAAVTLARSPESKTMLFRCIRSSVGTLKTIALLCTHAFKGWIYMHIRACVVNISIFVLCFHTFQICSRYHINPQLFPSNTIGVFASLPFSFVRDLRKENERILYSRKTQTNRQRH